ncbi:MAG: hypothetical protein HY033_05985 [Ignavibacteriae bacterium]|nr:hypothetical protein [Ignavibacteria bacterium]MBI3364441.1 hypothetical protein [Ignavibacteriota bacterium]
MELTPDSLPLRAELIKHLSKEIEVLSTNMITTRLRAAFTVWVGPYILLGALVLKQQLSAVVMRLDPLGVSLLALVFGLYLSLAYIAGRMERYGALKCNEWRDLITRLGLKQNLDLDEVKELLLDNYLHRRIRIAYVFVWVAMFTSFVIILYILVHLGVGG